MTMTMSRRRFFLAGCVCALAGCLFPSLSDLSGDASTGNDASDVAVVDSPTAPDAGSFCDGVDATFCEDFDEPDGGYLDRWSPSIGDGNTVTTQTALVTSAPNALVVEVPSGNTGGASLWKDLPPNATEYDYSFSIRFEPYDAGSGYVLWGQIEVDNTNNAFSEYRFSTYNGGTKFEAHVYYPDGGNTIAGTPLSTTFAAGQWYRVDEILTVSPPPAKVQIMINSIQVLQTTITQATDGVGTAEFLAGIYHTSGVTGTWRLEIDDVVMRVK